MSTENPNPNVNNNFYPTQQPGLYRPQHVSGTYPTIMDNMMPSHHHHAHDVHHHVHHHHHDHYHHHHVHNDRKENQG
ncbi:MAG: hypothetical protein K6T94_26000 [Paenibacillus sp.]|nr:hypothetical protein [Paenibacillus sp.]